MRVGIIKNSEKPVDKIAERVAEHFHSWEILLHTQACPELDLHFDMFILSGGRLDFRGRDFDGEKQLIMETRKPLFGICMGFQLICSLHGVDLIKLPQLIEGVHKINVEGLGELGMTQPDGWLKVWQNHRCAIPRCPDGFKQYGQSESCVEMIAHETRPVWATQFHPENIEDNNGRIVLDHFLATNGNR